MTNARCEDLIKRKRLGGAGVKKGVLGLSLGCQKLVRYVGKSRADTEKAEREMRKRDDVGRKTGNVCSQALTGLGGTTWAELAEVPEEHKQS